MAGRQPSAHRATRLDRATSSVRRIARLPFDGVRARPRVAIGAPHAVPVGLAGLVVVAALVSFAPGGVTGRTPDSAVLGAAGTPRIAAYGGVPFQGVAAAPGIGGTDETRAPKVSSTTQTIDAGIDAIGPFGAGGWRYGQRDIGSVGPLVDARQRLTSYTIHKGDSLVSIANKFHIHASTIWWANKLASPTSLPVGKTIVIPPVDGLVVTVKATDTLESIAASYDVDKGDIVDANDLTTEQLTAGQVLLVPGATGKPMPAPKVTAHPKAAPKSSGGSASPASHYTPGRWLFPVVGGGAYISQYFHASHPAIDIAADYGTPVRAAHGGRVTFAGWKDNGGGWQVWISHGNNLFTTYNHMSSLAVHTGQLVATGQRVGRIGMTGNATGPHLHFEVWRGPIWDGGVRLNPLNFV